jgi:hypothetical protein
LVTDWVRAPVWLGKDYQLQCQPAATAGSDEHGEWLEMMD